MAVLNRWHVIFLSSAALSYEVMCLKICEHRLMWNNGVDGGRGHRSACPIGFRARIFVWMRMEWTQSHFTFSWIMWSVRGRTQTMASCLFRRNFFTFSSACMPRIIPNSTNCVITRLHTLFETPNGFSQNFFVCVLDDHHRRRRRHPCSSTVFMLF